jgi:Ankyrin repeats (3 copies)
VSSILLPPQNGCSESKLVAELRSEEFQVKLPELQFERSRDPVPSLKAALSCRSAPETQLIFKAIQWVGLALRPLAVDELLHALNTSTDVSPHGQDLEVRSATVRSREQLMELCFGLLEINDAELVGFANANLRTLVSSPDFPGISPMNGSSGHEMLAIVCIKHLQCLDRQTLLKPWISTTHWLLNGRHECPLRGYATNFWDEHSRMAQSNCTYLTATLHQAILGAISKDDKSDPFHMPTTRGRTNVGLWLCCFYGFKPLVKTYLEMGADPNSRTFWPGTPLHAAVANSDFETVLLLLDRGGDPHSPNETGFTSIDLASSSGNEQMARLLDHRAELRESSTRPDATLAKHRLCDHFLSSQSVPQGNFPSGFYMDSANADGPSEAPNCQDMGTSSYGPLLPCNQTHKYHGPLFHSDPPSSASLPVRRPASTVVPWNPSYYSPPPPCNQAHKYHGSLLHNDPSSPLCPITNLVFYPGIGPTDTCAVAANTRVTGSEVVIEDTSRSPILNHHPTSSTQLLPLPATDGNSDVNEELGSKGGHRPNGESRVVREALATNTQRLESLAFPQANFTRSCCNRLQSSEQCEPSHCEEWVVVEREDVEMEMS